MCSPTLAIMAIGTVVTAYGQKKQADTQAKSIKLQAQNNQRIGEYNAQVAEQNAEIQRRAKDDALERGAQSAAQIRENARKANARGRAIMGSSGLLVDTGSNLDLLSQNAGFGEQEALTAFNNAEREAYGFEIQETDLLNQAQNIRYQGDLGVQTAGYNASAAKQSGNIAATSTLISGASSFGKAGGFDPATYKAGWKWR